MAIQPRQPRQEDPKLFLSFDCAEKSLAWALLRVETPGPDAVAAAETVALAILRRAKSAWEAALAREKASEEERARATAPRAEASQNEGMALLHSVAAATVPKSKRTGERPSGETISAQVEAESEHFTEWMRNDLEALDRLLAAGRGFTSLIAGSAVDLSEGAKGFLPPVKLARKLSQYLRESVDPHVDRALAEAVGADGQPKMWVGIEWQMGANVKSRRVHTMLLAHYAGDAPDVEPMFVPATLKNSRIYLTAFPETSHAAARKKSKAKRNYGANKSHAVILADRIAQSLGFKQGQVWESIPSSWLPDFSDAFLQALVVARMDPGERRQYQNKFG